MTVPPLMMIGSSWLPDAPIAVRTYVVYTLTVPPVMVIGPFVEPPMPMLFESTSTVPPLIVTAPLLL